MVTVDEGTNVKESNKKMVQKEKNIFEIHKIRLGKVFKAIFSGGFSMIDCMMPTSQRRSLCLFILSCLT